MLIFLIIRRRFWAINAKLNKLGTEPFLVPFWKNINKQMEKDLKPQPPLDFLNLPQIKNTMFVSPSDEWEKTELSFVKNHAGSQFFSLSKEDYIGKPVFMGDDKVRTSTNTVHHLYHIFRFLQETKASLGSINSVVEWGGGYGNQAKLWRRLQKNESTYTIIDTALFCTIQWLYLTSIFGPKTVNLLERRGDKIKKGKINIVPLALLDETSIKGDLFLSTWGLSESMASAQDYVINRRKWFGTSRLLIGFQDSTPDLKHASRLGELSKEEGAKIIDIKFIPNNHYAFK